MSSYHRTRSRRATIVTALLATVAFAAFVLALMLGSYVIAPLDVVASLFGWSADASIDFIVLDLRLPRALTAAFAGLALGASGIIFQRILANPLASPDFVGVSSGAGLAAAYGVVILGVSGLALSALALAGALASALAIYLLAWRGGITGYRFVLIGIGVSAFMIALIGYVLARAALFEARAAMRWLVGSVGLAGEAELAVLIAGVSLALPLAVLLGRTLTILELGDDTARALGSSVETARLSLLGLAICLIALATATVGPIMFVALIAGPIASRILGSAGSGIAAAACVGATILLSADLLAQHLLKLPTGVVTGAVGAPYLVWILISINKEGRGG